MATEMDQVCRHFILVLFVKQYLQVAIGNHSDHTTPSLWGPRTPFRVLEGQPGTVSGQARGRDLAQDRDLDLARDYPNPITQKCKSGQKLKLCRKRFGKLLAPIWAPLGPSRSLKVL